MASISFYLDRVSQHNPKSTEERSVYYYATWKSKRDRKSTDIKVKECDWIPSFERINPKLTGAKDVNDALQKFEDTFNKLFEQPFFNPEVEEMERFLKSGINNAKDFYTLFDEFLIDRRSRINEKRSKVISEDTIDDYRACRETVKEFESKKKFPIRFSSINADFYSKFRAYCIEDLEYEPSYFGAKIKKLKTFLYWCQERDVVISNRFHSFQIPQAQKDPEPLYGDELKALWDLKLNEEYQKKLDVVLALCSAGMRISDYNIVMTNMDNYIKDTHEGKAIIYNAQKTNELCIVPFFDDQLFRPVYLYEKYKGKMPRMDGQVLNDWIKQIDFLPHRIKQQSSKVGRITLPSIKYHELGIEAQFVMSITGHATEKEFLKYVGKRAGNTVKASREKGSFLKAG